MKSELREGISVCDGQGREGVVFFSSAHLTLVEWSNGYVECVPASRRHEVIMGVGAALSEAAKDVMDEVTSLLEDNPQNPFANKARLGPGPNG